MTVLSPDGKVLTPADGREFYVAAGKLGGRPKRMRLTAHRRRPEDARDAIRHRLMQKVRVVPETGCWEWTDHRDKDGYGRLTVAYPKRHVAIAHRLAYQLFVGEIPDEKPLDHLCRNRACCNPRHLEPVTVRENNLRGIGFASVNAAKAACDAGHPFAGANLHIDKAGERRCVTCRRIRSRLADRGVSTETAKATGLWATLERVYLVGGFSSEGLAGRHTTNSARTQREAPIDPFDTTT